MQWYCPSIIEAAFAPSFLRMPDISSGPSVADPQSPAVMVAMCTLNPFSFTNLARVPAHKNSASSGCASTQSIVLFMACLTWCNQGLVGKSFLGSVINGGSVVTVF
mgnify:CR=1 FL=1